MATPKTFSKTSINTTSDQDALQIKDVKGEILGWIDSTGTGQGNLASGGGGGGTPGGANTQIQFNNSGSFGGDSNLTWDNTNKIFEVLTPNSPIAGNTDGKVLIGSSDDIISVHSTYAVGATFYVHAAQSFRAPILNFYKSRGTQGSPTAIQSGDSLGGFNYGGYDGTTYATGVSLTPQASETWTNSAHGGQITFQVVPIGTTAAVGVVLLDGKRLSITGGSSGIVLRHVGFTVASLPSGLEGDQSYATNGRKIGEGVGSGTGVPVYFSNGSWRVYSTDAAVQA
jgi:hypothetical protein